MSIYSVCCDLVTVCACVCVRVCTCVCVCVSPRSLRIGRKSARLVRAAALRLADELLAILQRPSVALVTRCQEGLVCKYSSIPFSPSFSTSIITESHSLSLPLSNRTEPVIFKTRFIAWEDIMAVDFTRTPEMLEKRAVELVNISCTTIVPRSM